MKVRPWHFGNTTVRNPFRLQDGLIALANSPLVGFIKGKENETRFAWLLHESGVVNIFLPDREVSDMGRKWRSAMSQLGFIVPEVGTRAGLTQADLGAPFTITSNGRRLIEAKTVFGVQECFLRSLAAYYIPSALERNYKFSVFSPLRHTLAIMLELEQRTGDSKLNFLEMGLCVQFTSSDNLLSEVVDRILEFRAERDSLNTKRRFDQAALNAAARQYGYKAGSFRDYADLNFRYLKATGLVQSKGKGISIIPEKRVFTEKLVEDTRIPDSDRSNLIAICEGAVLPTDNKDSALIVLKNLVQQLRSRGVPYNLTGKQLKTTADIDIVRHDIENILAKLNEDEYALRQAQEWLEIAEYMDLIIKPRRRARAIDDDNTISIPQAEAPAYFEWILWRAFLAIDSLANKPFDARQFKIDQDFLPVCTAPGNGPDLIFEFDDFVVVVEVTLTESSRQEAAEGEPVRRHVAEQVMKYKKPVYGLFIANKIDSNTAETFRIGVWYARDDTKMCLDIVPLTLSQFKVFFEALFRSGNVQVKTIHELLHQCSAIRSTLEASQWKEEIEKTVLNQSASLNA